MTSKKQIILDARMDFEERLNTYSHGIAACVVAFVSPFLIGQSVLLGGARAISGAAIFAATLLLLLVASTMYHQEKRPIIKARLKVFDHCAIFLLIAGSYTPFTLLALKNHGGHWMLLVIWSLAAAGVIFKLFFAGRFRLVSTLIYLAMGWLVMAVIGPLFKEISAACAFWLMFGGASYTLGAGFYMVKRMPYSHPIWHLFVILGGGGHFIAVALQTLSPGAA
jgi:hemolysin III